MKIEEIKPSDINECMIIRTNAIKNSPWLNKTEILQPNLQEEEAEFKKVILNSNTKKNWKLMSEEKIIGILTTKKSGNILRIGSGDREPFILENYRDFKYGRKLIEEARIFSIKKGLQGIYTILKEPIKSSPRNDYYFLLYQKTGMELTTVGLQLAKELVKTSNNKEEKLFFVKLSERNLNKAVDIINTSYRTNLPFQYDPITNDKIHTKLFIQNWMEEKDVYQYLVKNKTEIIGYTSFKLLIKENPKTTLLGIIGILPKHQKKGYGKKIIAKIEEELIKAGMEFLFVGTSVHNTPAIKLYTSMGFKKLYYTFYFYKVNNQKPLNIIKDKKEKLDDFLDKL